MTGFVKTGALALIAAALALYLGDATVFLFRRHQGTAYPMVRVDHLLATPLKGQKEEFDATDSAQVTYARTIFPQPGLPACWWLERHTSQWR